jgi:pyruvate carboxylase
MNLNKIIAFVLLAVSISLALYLYNSIDSTIEERKAIASTEAQVIDKLNIIREAEKAYLEQFGKYTSSWDTLINFIENGKVPIIEKKETIIPKGYGVEEVIVKIDTIGEVAAKDQIFKKNYTITAAENGELREVFVKAGDQVVKGSKSYRMKKDNSDKTDELSFLEAGTITSVTDKKVGDRLSKGDLLISFWNYVLNPDVDIKTLGDVPGSEGKKFDIYTGFIERGGLKISVIEVKDPAPINPERNEKNETKNRKPLRFGSRLDVSTAGNWE